MTDKLSLEVQEFRHQVRITAAAICGDQNVLPAHVVGCGKPILTCKEVYRCTDCHVPFHRDCAIKHFSAELTEKDIEITIKPTL